MKKINKINTKIKMKNMLCKNQDKLINLIYTKRKKEKVEIKKELKKISQENYRVKGKKEKEIEYTRKTLEFKAKSTKKLKTIANNLQTLGNNFLLSKVPASKSVFVYWREKTKESIPYLIPKMRRYKKKKYQRAHNIYLFNIKRWTNLSEQRAKRFMSAIDTKQTKKNNFHYYNVLATWKHSYGSYFSCGTDFSSSTKKLKLNVNNLIKYKNLKFLRSKLLSKSPTIAFKPATKFRKAYSIKTPKQRWLSKKVSWLSKSLVSTQGINFLIPRSEVSQSEHKNKSFDFLKTILGQQLLTAHKQTKTHTNWSRLYWNKGVNYIARKKLTRRNWARKFQAEQKRAWFYTNLVFSKKLPYYFQTNSVTKVYPYKFFEAYWKERQRIPWLPSLISKRLLYTGSLPNQRREFKWLKKFSWIPFLRNKKSYRHKKNKLYLQRTRLLSNRQKKFFVHAKKKARIKQILAKSTLPFYGHLRLNQFHRLKIKAQIKKSNYLSRDEIQLGYLERRLDVIVYRLNLAPNIFWARKLIQDGSIYVSSFGANSKNFSKDFEKLYANYKQNTYPLKLRDPQQLYKKTELTYPVPYKAMVKANPTISTDVVAADAERETQSAKLKYLLEPLRNINYLTQTGDVILCAPGALTNQYKSNKRLWLKPIPPHLLTYSNITETRTAFKSRSNAFNSFSRKEQITTNVGVVLFNPTFVDLPKNDRIQSTFLRAMSL